MNYYNPHIQKMCDDKTSLNQHNNAILLDIKNVTYTCQHKQKVILNTAEYSFCLGKTKESNSVKKESARKKIMFINITKGV